MKVKKLVSKLNQSVKPLSLGIALAAVLGATSANAQDVQEVRWKSESHVRSLYGEPNSIQGPIGTHASYTLWKYDNFSVAFANNRAFHLFNKDSLTKTVELEENRPQ